MSTRAARIPLEVPGHPLRPRDAIEVGTFSRDLAIADYYAVDAAQRPLWLAARASARRDLLWHSRNTLGLSRLTEMIHRPAANFVQSIITSSRYGFGSFRDPRGNGKTSLSTRAGALWTVIQDPIECIQRGWAILGRESRLGINTLKAEFTANLMQLLLDDLEQLDFRVLWPDLFPETPRRWGQKGIELARGLPRELRSHPLFTKYPAMTRFSDPTFSPGSLESGRAGAHTHGEFIDDPVNEKTWNSELNIRTAVHGIRQLFNIIRPERGFRLVTGNDWCPNDVNQVLDEEDRAWRVFMRSATACAGCKDGYPVDAQGLVAKDPMGRPAHKHEGETFTWLMPESDGQTPDLAEIKRHCGSIHIYLAQYENDPVAPEATAWQSDSLPRYNVIDLAEKDNRLGLQSLVSYPCRKPTPDAEVEVCRVRDLRRTLTFDPSSGGMGSGASEAAITVLGRTPADSFCWLEALAKQGDPLSMLGVLIERAIYWRVHRIGIESVAYARIIKPLLIREFDARGVNWLNWEHDIVPIVTTKAEGDKEERIRSALNPLINGRLLLVSPHMHGFAPAMLQLDGFPIRKPWDTLDALAMHSHLWDHIPRSPAERRRLKLLDLKKRNERARNAGVSGYGW